MDSAPNDNPNWDYKSDSNQPNPASQFHAPATSPSAPRTAKVPAPPSDPASSNVTWSASEYIHHERTAAWYILLFAGTALLAACVYFLTKDYFGAGVIVALGVIVAVFAGRKPQLITYELTNTEIKVGQKSYPYSSFRSFSIMHQSGVNSINLVPTKRFMPMVSAFYAPSDEQAITDQLGNHLPYEERQPDSIDKLTARLRF